MNSNIPTDSAKHPLTLCGWNISRIRALRKRSNAKRIEHYYYSNTVS